MDLELMIATGIGFLLLIYLVYVLIYPERF